jgi:hypothetical protein
MPFPSPESHYISLEEAAVMTARFRESNLPAVKIGGLFNAEDVQAVLDQERCEGLRYYYGLNDTNTPVLILVGVDSENEDLYDGLLLEMSVLCPDFCAGANPLNSNG